MRLGFAEIVIWTIQKIVTIMEHQIEMDVAQLVILNLVKDLHVILMACATLEKTCTHVGKTVLIKWSAETIYVNQKRGLIHVRQIVESQRL